MTEAGWMWGLAVSAGALILGLAILYGILNWRKARQEETPEQKRHREAVTRENFGKVEDPVEGPELPFKHK